MGDYKLMKRAGCVIPEYLNEWVKEREKETLVRKHPKLNTIKKEFFNGDGVLYVYDHDSIHRAVAMGKEPAYTLFKKDGADVSVDKDKFFNLSQEKRLHSVAEEAMVLALERSHIPYGTLSEHKAFEIALQKVCTTISSGWWREFAWENYYTVKGIYNPNYLLKFRAAVKRGEITLHGK